jgi:hypothetical protein
LLLESAARLEVIMRRFAVLTGLLGLAVGSVGAGCARQQWKFDTLQKRDQLRFAACRTDVRRRMCPDDPDCEVKAAQAYADERPDARLQWLLDYGCARDKIQHVDDLERKRERERIGMPAE